MNKINKIVYFAITAIFFIIFDLYFSNILACLNNKISENDFLEVIYVQNTGAAFSLLESAPVVLVLFAISAILLIIIYGVKNIDKFSAFACFWTAMLVSGISCNLYERLSFGFVRDFFNLKFINFPVFNISDIFINIGVLALIIIIIKNKYLKK